MAKGSCLCGKITYETSQIGPEIFKCHCKLCQKSSGSACGDYTTAPIAAFKWTSGESLLKKYESSPGFHRAFCTECGTQMPHSYEQMGIYFIQAGTLDDDAALVESTHMFLKSKAGWHEARQGLKEFQEYPG